MKDNVELSLIHTNCKITYVTMPVWLKNKMPKAQFSYPTLIRNFYHQNFEEREK